jgi:P27 family predicted phage terminase small subunit
VDVRRRRIAAPEDLSEAARRIWEDLVDSLAADHFAPSDAPLLRSYCEATAMADRAAAELTSSGPVVDGKASPWLVVQEKAHRAQIALSARLRLSPQSRFSRNKAGTTAAASSNPLWRKPGPWEFGANPLGVPEFTEANDDDTE